MESPVVDNRLCSLAKKKSLGPQLNSTESKLNTSQPEGICEAHYPGKMRKIHLATLPCQAQMSVLSKVP